MKLIPINTGFLSIPLTDMFISVTGESPEIRYPLKERNRTVCSIRSLLLITESGNVLIDTGVGTLIDQDVLSYYDYRSEGDWESLLRPYGFTPADITDIILTHLHFDHCGGCLKTTGETSNDTNIQSVFNRATCWISREQWLWAQNTQEREPDSFFEHTFLPLASAYPLKFVEKESEILPGIHVRFFHGHTRGLMLPVIETDEQTVVFAGDLIPTAAHLPIDSLMAYDVNPAQAMREKQQLLSEAKAKGWKLFFQHDQNDTFF